jgi:Uma2 family endonuclease
VKVELTSVLHQLAREADLGLVFADRALLTNEAARLSTEPDALFATWDTLSSGRLSRVPKKNREADAIELVGTPDVVVEVVSDSSVRKDLVALRERHARAGIPVYWIVAARGDAVRFAILSLLDGTYEPAAAETAPQPSRVFARSFRLERAKNRVGTWSYTLRAS